MEHTITEYYTSYYQKDHHLHSMENKKVLGKIKDECGCRPIREHTDLLPKMHGILQACGANIEKA